MTTRTVATATVGTWSEQVNVQGITTRSLDAGLSMPVTAEIMGTGDNAIMSQALIGQYITLRIQAAQAAGQDEAARLQLSNQLLTAMSEGRIIVAEPIQTAFMTIPD